MTPWMQDVPLGTPWSVSGRVLAACRGNNGAATVLVAPGPDTEMVLVQPPNLPVEVNGSARCVALFELGFGLQAVWAWPA